MLLAPHTSQPPCMEGLSLDFLQEMVPMISLSTIEEVVGVHGLTERAMEELLTMADPVHAAPPDPDISPHMPSAAPAPHRQSARRPAATHLSSSDSMLSMLLPAETEGAAAAARAAFQPGRGVLAAPEALWSDGDWAGCAARRPLQVGSPPSASTTHNGGCPAGAGWACNPPAALPKSRQWWSRWTDEGLEPVSTPGACYHPDLPYFRTADQADSQAVHCW